MKRTLLIARREYAAYAKTVGFWLSLLALPLVAVGSGFFVAMMEGSSQPRSVAVADLVTEGAPAREDFVRALGDGSGLAVRQTPESLASAADTASAKAPASRIATGVRFMRPVTSPMAQMLSALVLEKSSMAMLPVPGFCVSAIIVFSCLGFAW